MCNADTNVGAADTTSQCAGISYGTWSTVPDTTTGNGVVPEYYKFDNPQQVDNSSTYAITELQVQIVGAAGYNSSDLVYYSTIAHFVPANGFLNNVWWTNYESTGTPSSCQFYWTGYPTPGNGCPRSPLTPRTTSRDPSSPTTPSTWTGGRTSGRVTA